ncbi:hypothetical protein ACOMHN_034252 [Nucella lapillus]
MEGGHPGPTSKKHFSAINKRLQTLIQSYERAEDNEDEDDDENDKGPFLREVRMQHGVNHTVTSTLGGLLSLAHRLAQVHQRMTSTRGPRPGSEWTNLPPPLHLTDGRHGIFGVTSTRKGYLPLRESPFLAWKGVRAGALLPPPLPLAVVRHGSTSFRVMSTLGGGSPSLPSPTGRRADGGQYRSDGNDRGPPSSSSLAPGTRGTQGRPQRHVYTGTGGRNSPRDDTLAERRASTGQGEDPLCRHPDSKARGARGGPDTSRQDKRYCLTTLETRRASLQQAQRVAEGDNPVSVTVTETCALLLCAFPKRYRTGMTIQAIGHF